MMARARSAVVRDQTDDAPKTSMFDMILFENFALFRIMLWGASRAWNSEFHTEQ
jgi:hypothetical protein